MIKTEKHFELTEKFKINLLGVKLFRIKATRKSKYVNEGDLGGWIEKEECLSGDAWVYGNAEVHGDAEVFGNARISGDAWVYGNAEVHGDAEVFGNARISGDAWVYGNAEVHGDAEVFGNARISGDAWVYGNAEVHGDAEVFGNARISGDAWVYGNAEVHGDAEVFGNARISGDAGTKSNDDYCCFQKFGSQNRTTTFFREKDGNIKVNCGCFTGSIDEFEKQVRFTHGEEKNAKEYLAILEVVKIKFEL